MDTIVNPNVRPLEVTCRFRAAGVGEACWRCVGEVKIGPQGRASSPYASDVRAYRVADVVNSHHGEAGPTDVGVLARGGAVFNRGAVGPGVVWRGWPPYAPVSLHKGPKVPVPLQWLQTSFRCGFPRNCRWRVVFWIGPTNCWYECYTSVAAATPRSTSKLVRDPSRRTARPLVRGVPDIAPDWARFPVLRAVARTDAPEVAP